MYRRYNLRTTKRINYNEDAYYESIGIREEKDLSFDKQNAYVAYIKNMLIEKIRNKIRITNMVSDELKPMFIMATIDLGMEYIRKIGDSENFRLRMKEKINEMRYEEKMMEYKTKLHKYYNELDCMMDLSE